MHYLVTGGCGFIGAHLVRHLLRLGHDVTVIDDLSNATAESLPGSVTLNVKDVTEAGALEDAVQHVDGVFHLAAIVSVAKSTQHWLRSHEVTLGGTVALFDALARHGLQIPVVLSSTAAVYGDAKQAPFTEQSPCAPISAYGADKLACELHARIGHKVHGIPSVALRFFNVYGLGQNRQSPYAGVISVFTRQMQAGLPVTIYGDGEQTRDYIEVSDAVNAMVLAMQKLEDKSLSFGIFNICTGVPVTVNELAQKLLQLTGSRSLITYAPSRPDDIRISLGDGGLSSEKLGFKPKTSLQTGLHAMLG